MSNPEISEVIEKELVARALDARKWAYAPYSNYLVGASLLSASGKIYDGVNVENAAFPSGTCAERVAVFKAVSEGERNFLVIAVASSKGAYPCGACRQVLAEFGLDTLVIITDEKGEIIRRCSLGELLPGAFGPSQLLGPD